MKSRIVVVAAVLVMLFAVPASAHSAAHGIPCGKYTHGLVVDSTNYAHTRGWSTQPYPFYSVDQNHYALGSSGTVYIHRKSRLCIAF